MKKLKNQSSIVNEVYMEFERVIPVSLLDNGDIKFKHFVIRKNNDIWDLYDLDHDCLIASFTLRACAILAANEYDKLHFDKYFVIKSLDWKFATNYNDMLIHKHNISVSTSDEMREILSLKLSESYANQRWYKNKIYKLFKHTFV